MQDHDFYRQLLELHAPWQILDISIDQPAKRVDIHLGFGGMSKRGLFGLYHSKVMFGIVGQRTCPQCHSVLPKNGEFETISIRHLPTAGFATYLHVPPPGLVKSTTSDCVCMQSWIAPGTRCTEAMHSHVVALLKEISNPERVLQLTGIGSEEMRAIIASAGLSSADEDTIKSTLPRRIGLIERRDIPNFDHPNWQLFINGKLPIQTSSVALRMLLKHVRMKCENSPTSETGIAAAKSLQQFFVRNQKTLQEELVQLIKNIPFRPVAAAGGAQAGAGNDDLPEESAAVWQRIAHGDQRIETRMVGLQMIIEQVRKSIANDQSPENRQTAIRNLRNFFLKNKVRLIREIAQLRDSQETPVNPKPTASQGDILVLPDEADPIWDRLINGEVELQNDAISLRLLLGRIRLNLATKANGGNKLNGAQLLRKYFSQNRQRHAEDIEFLIGKAK